MSHFYLLPGMNSRFTIHRKGLFRITILFILILLTSHKSFSQSFGSFASAVYLNVNGTQQFYNTSPGSITANSINPAAGAPFLTGNLGSFVQNSNSLILKGGEIKTYKNGGANVCQPDLFYRVYLTGSPAPSFTQVGLNTFTPCSGGIFTDPGAGPCSGDDQKWGNYVMNSDLTTLCPGVYTFEVYYAIPGSFSGGGCGSTVYDSNGGNNYIANFTVTSDLLLTASSNSALCAGNTLNLNTSVTGGSSTYSYLWNGPSGYTSSNATPTIASADITASGNYSVSVTDGCGQILTVNVAVTVNPLPQNPDLTFTSPTCTDQTGSITITAPTAGVDYSFDNGGSYVAANSTSGLNPGTYQIKIKDDATGCESPASSVIIGNVLATPMSSPTSNSPECSGSAIELTAADAGPGSSYSWTGPNGFTSSDQNPIIPYTTAAVGTYTLTITNMDNCTAVATTDVNCSALPVRLISFDGTQTENEIQLKWEAVDASNFSYFEIERGNNAKNFTSIERINFDYNERFYHMTDKLPLNGINYYRLNMVDTDGSHAYSKTINVKHHDGKESFAKLENPATSHIIHLFTNIQPVSVYLISVTGIQTRLEYRQVNENEWLINSENIGINQLSLIRINGKNESMIRKIIRTR